MVTTPILTIIEFLLYGAVRYVLFWIPGLTPFAVSRPAPWQWFRYNGFSDWLHRDDNNGGPDEQWLNAWFEMAIGELKVLAVGESRPYVDAAKNFLLGIIGTIRTGFSSMAAWTDWLQRAVGYYVPGWMYDIIDGLNVLRNKLPSGIKYGWQSWYDLWENIKSAVRSWAMARYDEAKRWAYQSFDWVVGLGAQLQAWMSHVSGWLDHIRGNPYAWIAAWLGGTWSWLVGFAARPRDIIIGWLGSDWPRLLAFARDCLNFYYALWSRGWRILSAFTDDPLGYLYARIEQMLVDRW